MNIKIKQFNYLIMLILKLKKVILALVGPSGSGKSSFLHLLALLETPSKGKILLNNKDTNGLSEIEKDFRKTKEHFNYFSR